MSKYNRWRRRVRRQKIDKVIHRLSRRTDSEEIRNRAIDLLDDFLDYQARRQSEVQPFAESLLKIQYQLLQLISEEEMRHTEGKKKFRLQKMAFYEEKIWDLYCELKDQKERWQYLSTHSSKARDRRALKKNIRQLERRIKKLKKDYRKVSRTGLWGLFRKEDHSDDFILDRHLPNKEEE